MKARIAMSVSLIPTLSQREIWSAFGAYFHRKPQSHQRTEFSQLNLASVAATVWLHHPAEPQVHRLRSGQASEL